MAEMTLLRLETPPPTTKHRYSAPGASTRSFGAAKISRQTMDWAMDPLSRDQKLFQALKPLRYRSRQLADNDSTMARFLWLLETNVIGPTGVRMQPKVKMLRGNALDDKLNKQITAEWHQWCRKGNCTTDGKLSFHALERLFIRTAAQDGEALLLKNAWDNSWGFALQVLDVDQLDTTYFSKWNGQSEVRMGVEIDKFQRPIAYWLWSGHPSELGQGPQNRYRIDASPVLHCFSPDSARQTRGVPWAAPVMSSMNMLRGYMEAEVVAARVGASVMGFIRKPTPEGDAASTDLDDVDETRDDRDPRRTDGEEIESTPGGFHTLFNGEDVTTFKSEHPTVAFSAFVKECKRDIATGLQVAYTSLFDDLSEVNFSSIRAGLLSERDTHRMRQKWAIENFHQPVFRAWLSASVLAGRIDISVRDIDAVCVQIAWHPRGWDWVDPLKDEQAAAMGTQNLTTTLTRVCAQRGLDLDELIEERAAELAKIKAAGITVGTDNKGDATTASDDKGDASDPDEKQPAQSKPKA